MAGRLEPDAMMAEVKQAAPPRRLTAQLLKTLPYRPPATSTIERVV